MGKSFFSAIFHRDHHRCVYCGRDLLSDYETFALATEDHLLPKKHGGADDDSNRVIACSLCNSLKGWYVPEGGKDLYDSKIEEYIRKVREHIAEQREKRRIDYLSWLFNVDYYKKLGKSTDMENEQD